MSVYGMGLCVSVYGMGLCVSVYGMGLCVCFFLFFNFLLMLYSTINTRWSKMNERH